MRQKGFAPIFLLIIIAVVVAVGIGLSKFMKQGATPRLTDQGWGQKPGGAQDFGGPPSQKPRWSGPVPTPPKGEITYYKGLWAANWVYPDERTGLVFDSDKYKNWGVNIINLQPGFEINAKGETRYPLDFPTHEDMDARMGELATKFYKAGVKLGITIQIHYKEKFVQGVEWGGETAYIPKEKIRTSGYLKNYDEIVADMAKIAEKYHFYFFSPMGEPENVFYNGKLASDWSQQILPQVKKYYKGKVYYKGDLHKGQGDVMNFKGYDILGMVTSPLGRQESAEAYRKSFDSDMDRVLGWAKRDGVAQVVISEYGYLGNQQMESAEHFGILLEEASKKLNGAFVTEPVPAVFKTSHGNQIVAELKKWFLR